MTKTKIVLSIFAVAAIALVIVFVSRNYKETAKSDPVPLANATQFAWRYQEGSEGPDGLPQTQVLVDVSYENGKTVSTKVDEVQGSCNDIDPKAEDADRLPGTTKIQCYAAGLGQWYKIIRGTAAYEVRKKEFVEAEPDSVPPEYHYETVVEIPLTI